MNDDISFMFSIPHGDTSSPSSRNPLFLLVLPRLTSLLYFYPHLKRSFLNYFPILHSVRHVFLLVISFRNSFPVFLLSFSQHISVLSLCLELWGME